MIYKRAPRLFADIAQARGEGRLARLMTTLERANLQIIDDWGPEPLNAEQRRDLLEIVDDRYDRGSLLITSQTRPKQSQLHQATPRVNTQEHQRLLRHVARQGRSRRAKCSSDSAHDLWRQHVRHRAGHPRRLTALRQVLHPEFIEKIIHKIAHSVTILRHVHYLQNSYPSDDENIFYQI